MLKVIPAINVNSFEELELRLKLVEPYTDWAQIDVSDGTFTKLTGWHQASDLLQLHTPLKIEVHLMIDQIEERVDEWLIAPVSRVVFHLEASKDPHFVIKKCRDAGKEVGIAIGPDTSWTRLVPFYNRVDLFQILAVYPGPSGQKFSESSFAKISDLRKNCPDAIIEVDGGINKNVAKRAHKAGANIVNAASYIFNSDNIKKSIEDLKNT